MVHDHREDILKKLSEYMPTDGQEKQYKEQIVSFITKHKDCFERSLTIGHITGSAWLLDKTGEHALLMFHKKLGIWVQPGGHCDGESDVLTVALKEAQEESGILGIRPVSLSIFDLDVHHIPMNKKEAEHYHYDIRFLLQVYSDEPLVQNEESCELKWFSKDRNQLPTSERSITRMFDKWILR